MIKSGRLIIPFIFLLFLPVAKSYSQTRTLDSLKNLLKRTLADTSRMKILFEMTDFEGKTNLDSALNLVTKAEDLALKQKQKKWLAKVYLARGFIFYRQSLNDLALYYFMKGNMLFVSLHDPKGISDALNRIALVYKNQHKYQESLVLFKKSLLIRTSLYDQQRISITLNNIGNVYVDLKQYKLALSYYQRSYKIDSATHDSDGISKSSFNIGYIYDQLGDHKRAMEKYQHSLAISNSMNDKWEIADTYYYIALSAGKYHNNQLAFNYSKRCEQLAQTIHAKELLQRVHKLIAGLYEQKGQYKQANANLKAYVQGFENEFNATATHSIEDLQHKYELENKEILMEKAHLRQEAKLATQYRILKFQWFFITAIVLILVLALSLVFLLNKNQQEKQASLIDLTRLNFRIKLLNENLESIVESRTAELTETKENIYHLKLAQVRKEERLKTELNKQIAEAELKALRAQMNPHFIFNCLNSINGYIVKNAPLTASSYLSKFAKLMRLILNNSKQPLIYIEDEIAATRLYMELEQLRFKDKFSFEIVFENELLLAKHLIPPLLLQPYIENSIWHGLMHNDNKGDLKLTIRLIDKEIVFQILDNGIGRDAAEAIKKGHELHQKSFGLKMGEERLALLSSGNTVHAQVEIIDLFDYSGIALGTLVQINVPDNLKLV